MKDGATRDPIYVYLTNQCPTKGKSGSGVDKPGQSWNDVAS